MLRHAPLVLLAQVPQHILLSVEVGSRAGDITKATLPDSCLVDRVRVYDLRPLTPAAPKP